MINYILRQWDLLPANGNARVILLFDQTQFKAALNIPTTFDAKSCINMIKDEILQLDLLFPVYYIYLSDVNYSSTEYLFFQPPNPGTFAFIQYVHSLNFKESIYVRAEIFPDAFN
jgi:hypothetical protein